MTVYVNCEEAIKFSLHAIKLDVFRKSLQKESIISFEFEPKDMYIHIIVYFRT